MKDHDFSDILNAQGFKTTTTAAANQKNTLKQLQNEQNGADMDPIKRKVKNIYPNYAREDNVTRANYHSPKQW